MLTRARKETIDTALTIKGQGESVTFNVTFHNRKQTEIEDAITNGATLASVLLFMVSEWEAEYPLTEEGVKEMEADRPGITLAIMQAFHEARRVEKEKNS